MITGAHAVIYSTDAQSDKEFFKNVLKFPSVDVGHGWLIFGLPPSEIAVHPSDGNDSLGFYLLCNDIRAFTDEMREHNVECSLITEQRWGLIVQIQLPSGAKLGVYEPKHARP